MGKQTDQPAFLYDFALDKHVPADHMLRSIDRFVELDEMRANTSLIFDQTHMGKDRSETGAPGTYSGRPLHVRCLLRLARQSSKALRTSPFGATRSLRLGPQAA